MLSATEAPTPVLVASAWLAFASATLATKFSAASDTLPPSVIVTVALLAISPRASLMPTLIASAPATPVSPPLAPACAVAMKVCARSNTNRCALPVPAEVMSIALPSAPASWILPSASAITE